MSSCVSDINESSIPRWMFETGAVYLHGYDKEGNKLCMNLIYLKTCLSSGDKTDVHIEFSLYLSEMLSFPLKMFNRLIEKKTHK